MLAILDFILQCINKIKYINKSREINIIKKENEGSKCVVKDE